jgi:hypothetical protein
VPKRLVELRLLGVHIADAVVHPPFHFTQAGTLCRMQGDLVDLLPVAQVATQLIETEQRIGHLPARHDQVVLARRCYGTYEVFPFCI